MLVYALLVLTGLLTPLMNLAGGLGAERLLTRFRSYNPLVDVFPRVRSAFIALLSKPEKKKYAIYPD